MNVPFARRRLPSLPVRWRLWLLLVATGLFLGGSALVSACHQARAEEAAAPSEDVLSSDDSEDLGLGDPASPALEDEAAAPVPSAPALARSFASVARAAPPPAAWLEPAYAMAFGVEGFLSPQLVKPDAPYGITGDFHIVAPNGSQVVWNETLALQYRELNSDPWTDAGACSWFGDLPPPSSYLYYDADHFHAFRYWEGPVLSTCGHWRVRATATVSWNNATIPVEACYEFVCYSVSVSSEKMTVDEFGNKSTAAGWDRPRRKVTLSWQPADLDSSLPQGHALCLSSGYWNGSCLRLWGSATGNGQIPWQTWRSGGSMRTASRQGGALCSRRTFPASSTSTAAGGGPGRATRCRWASSTSRCTT